MSFTFVFFVSRLLLAMMKKSIVEWYNLFEDEYLSLWGISCQIWDQEFDLNSHT